jgi:hypothetical protein
MNTGLVAKAGIGPRGSCPRSDARHGVPRLRGVMALRVDPCAEGEFLPELRSVILWAAGLLRLVNRRPFDFNWPRFCAGRECRRNILPQVGNLWEV